MKREMYQIARWLMGIGVICMAAYASDGKSAVQERMKERYAAIQQLKEEGKAGERPDGHLESLVFDTASNGELRRLIAQENSDRKLLYKIIAKEMGVTANAVGEINARRVFEKASGKMYFKNGKEWRRKSEMDEGARKIK